MRKTWRIRNSVEVVAEMIRTYAVPLEVPSQNVTDRMHWRARKKLKGQWLYRIIAACGGPQSPQMVHKRVEILAYRKRLITDRGNLIGGCKLVVDAIRDAGLIFDDADKWATIDYQQELAGRSATGMACTYITIESRNET